MRRGEELAGRYRLERLLGRGGMGEVWQALDLRLDRQVAVKVLLVEWSGEQLEKVLARFRREGKAAARLNHPRIATVYDSDTHQGWPFLVLELLAGPDLAALLDGYPGGLPIGMLLEYGAQAAEGLAAAHAMGVIHRDVKPSNLMLDGHGTLKICDFGIARLSGATVGLTAAGTRIGTFAYTAPEQLLGKDVSGAADVYALGATLFHLLTGRLLFPADDISAVIGQQLYETPPPPSSLRPSVPQALDTYLITLLAKDPSSRPSARTIPARLRALATQLGPQLLLDDAERLARSITDNLYQQAEALAVIAKVASAWNPAMAEKLLADAEHLARTDNPWRPGVKYSDVEYAAMAQIQTRMNVAAATAEWNRAKATELLADVEPLTRSLYYPDDVEVLTDIAKLVRAWNPAMAEKMLTDAERLARTTPHPYLLATLGMMASAMAEAMAAADPAGAEHLARTIADPRLQADALIEIAKAIRTREPAQADELLADAERLARNFGGWELIRTAKAMAPADPARAERLARAITDRSLRPRALAGIADALYTRDPDRAGVLLADAERLARTIDFPYRQAEVLAEIAKTMAKMDPAGAERLARSINDPRHEADALAEVAKVMTTADPARAVAMLTGAERLARTANPLDHGRALGTIAKAMAEADPAGAERLARSINDPRHEADALMEIAKVVHMRDSAKAEELLADAERLARTTSELRLQAEVLTETINVMGTRNPAAADDLLPGAERLARTITITHPNYAGDALVGIARAMAELNPAAAERLARAITDPLLRPRALMEIAKVIRGRDLARAQELVADAERLARATSHPRQDRALEIIAVAKAVAMAVAMAAADPAGAGRLARTINDPRQEADALMGIAEVVHARDPARAEELLADAERLVRTINDRGHEADALMRIAKLIRARDPVRAEELLADAELLVRTISDSGGILLLNSAMVARIASAMAEQNLAIAERLARSITHSAYQAMALAEIAKVLVEQPAA
jgi:hypothetical protein